jgi:two-component system OmpR family response regulator
MAAHILIVDDDPKIRDVIRIAVAGAGMTSAEAANGSAALTQLGRAGADLVVLDVGMPVMDGYEFCKAVRARADAVAAVPILFLTARDDEIDRVLGFQLGADDFVSKPFSPRELVLRIRAILARGTRAAPRRLTHGALELDSAGHACRIGAREVELTATEFALLRALLEQPDRVHDRNGLIGAVYGANSTMSARTVDSHIRNIRAKAAALGCDDIIATIHGVGVKLGPCRG